MISEKQKNYISGKLDKTIVIEKVQLITEKEEEAGYNETPFSFELVKY